MRGKAGVKWILKILVYIERTIIKSLFYYFFFNMIYNFHKCGFRLQGRGGGLFFKSTKRKRNILLKKIIHKRAIFSEYFKTNSSITLGMTKNISGDLM